MSRRSFDYLMAPDDAVYWFPRVHASMSDASARRRVNELMREIGLDLWEPGGPISAEPVFVARIPGRDEHDEVTHHECGHEAHGAMPAWRIS